MLLPANAAAQEHILSQIESPNRSHSRNEERGESTPLSQQVAVITGAGRGIGAAIAAKLARLGARTILCGRTRAALEQNAAAIQNSGGQSAILECDVTDLRSVESLAVRVDRTFGRLDILV
ncbi:MAG: SDR family NAD(P)-dependent oxidoreductase, partial [Terriglobales bacterium]